MRRRVKGAAWAAGWVAFALAIGPQVAVGASDVINAVDEFTYDGGIEGGAVFRLDAGQRAELNNSDPSVEHNVVARDDGPDGNRLFASALVAPLESGPVDGTQYLQPGDYDFYCTIHSGMSGAIQVAGSGAVARPEVDVAVASSKLEQLSRGRLRVRVSAATLSDGVSVIARVGGKPAGDQSAIDLAAGAKRTLKLELSKSARKEVKAGLKKGRKVAVSVSSEVPWGAPDSARRTLK